MGLAQLDKFAFIMKRRTEINEFYHRELKDAGELVLPPVLADGIYSHFNIRVKNRAGFISAMKKRGVHVGKELFDYCIPDFKCYQGFSDGDFNNARQASREIVNLPSYPHLANGDLARIVDAVKKSL